MPLGYGKTRTGRLWTYVVDERPWQGERASAAYYRPFPDALTNGLGKCA